MPTPTLAADSRLGPAGMTHPGRDVDEEAPGEDEGPGRGAPVRSCAMTRERLSRDALVRFVLSPDGDVVPDIKARLPGRGVWVTASRETLLTAVRKGVFARAFRRAVKAGGDLPDQVDALIAKEALQSLSLAIKAGEAVFGFAKVEETIRRDPVVGLLHAREAGADGVRKLDGAYMKRHGERPVTVCMFTTAELDLASGRNNVIHAALIKGGASARFLQNAGRLKRYRDGTGDPAGVSNTNAED